MSRHDRERARERDLRAARVGAVEANASERERQLSHRGSCFDAAFEHAADPQLVLDGDGILIAVNARARSMFGLSPQVVGRPFQDLEISYRPVELRSTIDQARSEGRTLRLTEVPRWTPSGELTVLDIGVAPLSVEDQHIGTTLSFIDVTPP